MVDTEKQVLEENRKVRVSDAYLAAQSGLQAEMKRDVSTKNIEDNTPQPPGMPMHSAAVTAGVAASIVPLTA